CKPSPKNQAKNQDGSLCPLHVVRFHNPILLFLAIDENEMIPYLQRKSFVNKQRFAKTSFPKKTGTTETKSIATVDNQMGKFIVLGSQLHSLSLWVGIASFFLFLFASQCSSVLAQTDLDPQDAPSHGSKSLGGNP
ncbi:MAG: hypothetical protein GY866_24555, partial [Proteobacteria bacterium]|nr:hypothetical protein [Pseudomonadota bacterium]